MAASTHMDMYSVLRLVASQNLDPFNGAARHKLSKVAIQDEDE